MKTTSLAAPISLPVVLGPRRVAFALAIIVALLAGLAAPRAFAQEQAAPAADKPAPDAGVTELPPVNHLVYLAQLPTPAALIKEAAAQGATVQRIDRTNDSVVVVCKYADGHTDTTGYTTLSAASTQEEPAAVVAATDAAPRVAPTVTLVSAPPTTTVVYSDAPAVYYEPRYRYYDPYDNFWAPLALGIGIGWVSGGHGGYYHGHYSHGFSHGHR